MEVGDWCCDHLLKYSFVFSVRGQFFSSQLLESREYLFSLFREPFPSLTDRLSRARTTPFPAVVCLYFRMSGVTDDGQAEGKTGRTQSNN